jgi:tripartite-type tricarboxylate transporter receptor subunit TctC
MSRGFLLALAALIAASLGTAPVVAAEWPQRPVRIVVPFSAGGAADTFGRLYADAFSAALGKPFYVENRLGAGGMIATEDVARAKPDGYTLLVSGIPTQVLGPAMNKEMNGQTAGHVGFDPLRDFTHIAFFGGAPNVFVVHPEFGSGSFESFMARAKASDGGIEYVSAGFGTLGNWVAEYLAARAGIKLVHVAYKGGANAVLDLIAGHVKVGMLTYPSVGEHIRAGTLVPLAVTASARLPQLPKVPTFRELGYPELVATTWFALSGPAGLPKNIVTKLNGVAVAALERPALRQQIEQDAVDVSPMTPAEVTQYFASEIGKWEPIIARVINAK